MSHSLSICVLLFTIQSQIVTSVPLNFVITTDATFAGNNIDNLAATLYWENNSYGCVFTPSSPAGDYTCDSNVWTTSPTSNTLLPYYIKVEYSASIQPIAINTIVITLDNALTYVMDTFCIHSNMACTFGLTSTGKCAQWTSKDEYDTIKLGGDTKFTLLYLDFRSDIASDTEFANIIHEGSVRPPDLVTLGITTVTNHDIDVVSAQWDNVYYRCSTGINAADPNKNFTCTIDESKACPGVDSNFWVSIYNPDTGTGQTVGVSHIRVIDETGVRYTMSQLCQTENAPFGITGAYCTVYSSKVQRDDLGIGWFLPKLIAWVAPTYPTQQCIFNYPNVIEPAVEIEIIDDLSIDGWDLNKYGGDSTIRCPDTPEPTKYPTFDPTLAPSLAPTQPPSLAPSIAPSIAPTQTPSLAPSLAPSLNPSLAPTQPPSNAPSIVPTQPPSLAPSLSPSSAPSLAPSIAPSIAPSLTPTQPPTNPSKFPTKNPIMSPSKTPTNPTKFPTKNPTMSPSKTPTKTPSMFPSKMPTVSPELKPTKTPTVSPSKTPTTNPSNQPTNNPTISPSTNPSNSPSKTPTNNPTLTPTKNPTSSPTNPTKIPTNNPIPIIPTTANPTKTPSVYPTKTPSDSPELQPTKTPTLFPSNIPSKSPTRNPSSSGDTTSQTRTPTKNPSKLPSVSPTNNPTLNTQSPTHNPTISPTKLPTNNPTNSPSILTLSPSFNPSSATKNPSSKPTKSPLKFCKQFNKHSGFFTDNYQCKYCVCNGIDAEHCGDFAEGRSAISDSMAEDFMKDCGFDSECSFDDIALKASAKIKQCGCQMFECDPIANYANTYTFVSAITVALLSQLIILFI